MKPAISSLFPIGLCTFGYLYATSSTTLAQVSSDGTVNTQVNQNGNVAEITGGETRGSNLFHSFREFSVPTNNQAFFNNADSIANIFSRVTGGKVSNIDGLIRANGDASLFLINPAGIIFGEGARLDIGGSFYGSSASGILFEDGEFSATDLDNPPLLTVNAPVGLSFRDNPAEIQLQEANLALQPRQTLAFFGGNIDIQGGAIEAPNGQIQLGGLGAAGTITLEEDLSFSISQDITRADVSISDGTFINAGGNRGGNIFIQGKNITTSGGDIFAGVFSAQATSKSQGGTIEFDATESITLTDSSIIETSSFGQGNAGNIIINAQDNLTIDNQSMLASISTTSQGQARNIGITTNSFTLDNESLIIAITTGAGDAGDINIEANSISSNNASLITNNTFGLGNAGNINIKTQSLALNDGSEIVSDTLREGEGGNIQVNASDSVTISGVAPVRILQDPAGTTSPGGFSSGLFSSSEAGATGNGGTISVTTGKLSISDGATLSGRTKSSALGGDIVVNADTLDLSGGGQIVTTASDEGNAGNITLNVANKIDISGSDPTFFSRRARVFDLANQLNPEQLNNLEEVIDPVSPESGVFANATSNSSGDGGNIFVLSEAITLSNQGIINVDNQGAGNGGNISLQANNLTLDNQASISAVTISGTGGNANIQIADNLELRNNSKITVGAFENADGGNISIDAKFIVAFPSEIPVDGNDFIASAERGDGGNISFSTEGVFGLQVRPAVPGNRTNDIFASSSSRGIISSTLVSSTQKIPQLIETEQTTTQACQVNREVIAQNALTIKGKGGVPPAPDLPLNSHNIFINGENTDATASIPLPIETSLGKIQPAKGIKVTEDGRVILTAYPTNNQGTRLPQGSPICS